MAGTDSDEDESNVTEPQAIRCTVPTCSCDCFSPGKTQLRMCETCKHGWVAHALEKLGFRHLYHLGTHVEIVTTNVVFDIASLMLYGTQATPIRLKILLDRLFSVLQHEDVLQVLHGFGWTYEDYARGYILQDASGRVLDKWMVATRQEEQIILQQFLRFGETRAIAQSILLQDSKEQADYSILAPRSDSDIKKFIERMHRASNPYIQTPSSTTSISLTERSSTLTPVGLPSPGAIRTSTPPPVSPVSGPVSTTRFSLQSASPVYSSSPLGKLQNMQPYDYRTSPSISPPEKQAAVSSLFGHNMALSWHLGSAATALLAEKNAALLSAAAKQEALSLLPRKDIKREPEEEKAQDLSTNSASAPLSLITSTPVSYADDKLKHLRKSNNPLKRRWGSVGLNSLSINPSTGKKRVQCEACLKTFCDKGALKIHFSAVHLREMHKCTVEGCNMMFSSRRSRNRHSANPNPKLHMAGVRRKTHLGAPLTLAHSPTSLGLDPSDGLPPTMVPNPYQLDKGMDLSQSSSVSKESVDNNANVEGMYGDDEHLSPDSVKDEDSCEATDMTITPTQLPTKFEQGTSRKRKSNTPTRCAQRGDKTAVNDEGSECELQGVNSNENNLAEMKDSENSEGEHVPEIVLSLQKQAEVDEDELSPDVNEDDEDTSVKKLKAREHAKEETHNGNADISTIKSKALEQMESLLRHRIKDIDVNESSLTKPDSVIPSRLAAVLGAGHASPGSMIEKNNDRIVNSSQLENGDSDQESNSSFSSGNSRPNSPNRCRSDGSDGSTNSSIPMDPENPRRCIVCGKMFQNHFGVKTHYQNVHLKLMHTCNVEGCNAAFPSKRSRDRHSANLNLHRKLLSTHGDNDMQNDQQSLRDEFLSKIYDSHSITELYKKFHENNKLENDHQEDMNEDEGIDDKATPEDEDNESKEELTNSHSYVTPQDAITEGPIPDPQGLVKCHVCFQPFRDNLVLKEHFEKVHPKEMFTCTVEGCEKIFSTRKSRNRHAQNDSLHKHLSLNGSSQ